MTSLLNQQTDATRRSDINAISELGPLSRLALQNSNPEAAGLVSRLTQQATEGMDAGSMMTGDELRNLNASLRSSMGARGISYGPASSYQEAMAGSAYGQQLKQQRQQDALAAINASQNFYGDPFMQILGRQSGAMQNGLASLGQSGASMFNPNAANDMWAGYNQSRAQTSAANAASVNSLIGGGLSAFGSLGAAGIGAYGSYLQNKPKVPMPGLPKS